MLNIIAYIISCLVLSRPLYTSKHVFLEWYVDTQYLLSQAQNSLFLVLVVAAKSLDINSTAESL